MIVTGYTLIISYVWCTYDMKDDNIILSYYMFDVHLLLMVKIQNLDLTLLPKLN